MFYPFVLLDFVSVFETGSCCVAQANLNANPISAPELLDYRLPPPSVVFLCINLYSFEIVFA